MKITNRPGTSILLLLLIITLPILFYTGYEINSLSANEEVMASIYNQQLESILFSINQYSWNVVDTWASAIGILLGEQEGFPEDSLRSKLSTFLSTRSPITTVLCVDTGLFASSRYDNPGARTGSRVSDSIMLASLRFHRGMIRQMSRYLSSEYRKIEPIQLQNRQNKNQLLALCFVAADQHGKRTVVTMVIDEDAFVRNLLAPKLQETAGQEFILAVLHGDSTLFTTARLDPASLKQRKALWLLPNSSLGIRPVGTTIDDIVHSRYYRNLILIILLTVVLIAGVFLVYRNMRREVELIRMKSDFVSNVSHELRTPLSLIRMFAETLEMGRVATETKRQQYYSTIVQETERLTRLINNVLSFARLDAGKQVYHFQPTELNETVSNVLETFRVQLQSEGFSQEIKLDPSLPPIMADAGAVSEAIVNIIDNALKYSGTEKFLKVSTGKDGPIIFLEVEDHGIGIDKGDQERIFEQFYRVTDGHVHDVKGTGLGLTLVRHVMIAHKGAIRVRSARGEGSTFRMEFPMNQTS